MKQKETVMEKLGRYITMAGNAILMNLLFLVCSLPIVTLGQAWCGLLSAVRYNIRGEKWTTGFWTGFKTRFLRGTVAWCAGLLVCLFLLNDVNTALAAGSIVPIIASCVMFAVAAMVVASLLVLNVYIPTDVGNWISNGVNMLFKAPLQLLAVAALMWLPVVLALLWDMLIFLQVIMIFVAVYFTLAALGTTMALKDALIHYLLKARTEGTLLAEEGKQPVFDDEDDEA